MAEIFFRKAKQEESVQIAKVMLDFYNMENLEEANNAVISEISKDYKYIISLENNKIIGLVTWLMHGLPKHGLFELDRICILKEARGKGIGRGLVNTLVEDAKNWYQEQGSKIRKLYLLTHEENVSAHLFYERVGFQHEVTLKDHYYENQDERLYSIFFNQS